MEVLSPAFLSPPPFLTVPSPPTLLSEVPLAVPAPLALVFPQAKSHTGTPLFKAEKVSVLPKSTVTKPSLELDLIKSKGVWLFQGPN